MKKLGIKRPYTFIIFGLLAILFIALQIPSIIGAQYNFNGSDDIWFGRFTHSEWVRSHNIFSVIGAALYTSSYIWTQWQGNFSAVFMFAFNPSTFDPWGMSMFFVPIIIITTLGLGVFFTFKQIFGEHFKIKWEMYSSVFLLMMIIFTQLVPTYRETFYWWAASVNYPFYLGITLITIAFILHYFKVQSKGKKIAFFALITFLAIFISGGMYVFFSMSIVGLIVVLIYKEAIYKNKKCRELYWIMVPYFVGWIINIAAPGNPSRMQSTEAQAVRQPVQAIWESIVYTFKNVFGTYIFTGTENTPYSPNGISFAFFAMFVIVAIFAFVLVKNSKFKFRAPGLLTVGSFFALAAWFCPFIYGSGLTVMPRVFNTGFIIHWLFILANLIYWIGWLKPYLIKFYKTNNRTVSDVVVGPSKGLIQLVAVPVMLALFFTFFLNMNSYANGFKAIHPGALGAIQAGALGPDNPMAELTCQYGNDGTAASKDPNAQCKDGTMVHKTQAEWNMLYINQFKHDLLGPGVTDAETDACIDNFFGATISGASCADKISNSGSLSLPDTPEEDKLLTAHLDMCPQAGAGYNKFAEVFWNVNNQLSATVTQSPDNNGNPDKGIPGLKNNMSVTANYPSLAVPLSTTATSKYGPWKTIDYYQADKQQQCSSQGMADLHA
jgi:hypothetical protein